VNAATIPCAPVATTELSLDELVARGLSASERDVVAAFQWAAGGSVISWVAKMRVAS
jgi:hypothetical protein